MSTTLREEPAPYGPSPEEAALRALERMDWAAYERQSQMDLKEAAAAYQRGDRGVPAREFFDHLAREDERTVVQ